MDVPERTVPKVCLVRKELQVYLDLLENLADLVWTEEKERQGVMENLVDLEYREVKEVLDDLELLVSPVEEASLDVMELRESPEGAAWTADLVLLA